MIKPLVAWEVDRVVYQLEGWWFDTWFLQFTFQNVLRQDTEPLIHPYDCEHVHDGYRMKCCVHMCVNMVCD